jgi:hypothetical protein
MVSKETIDFNHLQCRASLQGIFFFNSEKLVGAAFSEGLIHKLLSLSAS